MKKEEQSMNLTNYKLPVAELKADGSFYLDGAKIRAVQSYTIDGLRTDTRDTILTLKILIDPHLLIDNSSNHLSPKESTMQEFKCKKCGNTKHAPQIWPKYCPMCGEKVEANHPHIVPISLPRKTDNK